MDTETNLEQAPEVEAELTETEDQDDPQEIELDESGNPIEEPDEPEPVVDTVDIDVDGKSYKVPAALKDQFLMQADYTRKTQEVAEMRRAAESTLYAANQVSQVERQIAVAVGVIDTQLADYETIDWDTWDQTDPAEAQRAFRQFQMLKDQRQGVVNQYGQAQQHRTLLMQQETARQLEQGTRELTAKIPGWGQDKAQALHDHAVNAYGFTEADLSEIVDPRMLIALHDAFQFRQASKTQQTVRKVQAQQAVKPAAKVTGGTPTVRPLDDRASAEAWMKARNAQVAKRNK